MTFLVQYIRWLENAVRGDFGVSYKYETDVLEVIGGRLPNTLILGGIGFVLIFTLALGLGVLFAVHLRWLTSSGAWSAGGGQGDSDRVRHLILPLAAAVLGHLWYYAYMIRNKLLEETRCEYVLLVESKGLSKKPSSLSTV